MAGYQMLFGEKEKGPKNGAPITLFSSTAAYALATRMLLCLGMDVLEIKRMHLEHKRYYGLSMDTLKNVGTWNTNVIAVWA